MRAGLVPRPEDWMWSSARAHLGQGGDGVTDIAGLAALVARVSATGRPLGDTAFVRRLEDGTGRSLARRNPGPKPHDAHDALAERAGKV